MTWRGSTLPSTTQGRGPTAPAPTIATCGGWMIGNTASTADSPRLVRTMLGAASSLARSRPARARHELPEFLHQHRQRLLRRVHDGGRDEPAAAHRDRHANVDQRALLVAAVPVEAAEAPEIAAGDGDGLDQQCREQQPLRDGHGRVARREPLDRCSDVRGEREVVMRDLALGSRHRRRDRLAHPSGSLLAPCRAAAGEGWGDGLDFSTSSIVIAPPGPLPVSDPSIHAELARADSCRG